MRKSSIRAALVSFVVVLVVVIARSAHADGGVDTAARATSLFREGLERGAAGDADGACGRFAAAYALVPSVDILWNLAVSERRAGRLADAYRHFEQYVAQEDARPARKSQASSWLSELERETGTIDVDAPDSAGVEVDGVPAGARRVRVVPGMHVITARAGVRSTRVVVDVAAAQTTPARIALDEPEENVAQAQTVRSLRFAAAVEPILPAQAAPTTAPDAASSSSTARTWTIAILGASAVLAAGTGVALAAAGASERDDADRRRGRMQESGFSCARAGSLCDDYESARAASHRLEAASVGLFVLGGALAGASFASWLLWPAERASSVKVAGAFDGTSGALTASGRF